MTTKHIIAIGGGGFAMEEDNPRLDDYILSVCKKSNPRVCFIPTASGDNADYTVRFHGRFGSVSRTSHLFLFRRNVQDVESFLSSQDVVYVGGGNTVNMLAVWREHGVDKALKKAYEAGVILTGLSAGSICWFESGPTDSFGSGLRPMEGLGILKGSHCPHYDGEEHRRPGYHRMIQEGMLPGYAADDGAGLHFVDGELTRVVSSRKNARGYRVDLHEGVAAETVLDTVYLGE